MDNAPLLAFIAGIIVLFLSTFMFGMFGSDDPSRRARFMQSLRLMAVAAIPGTLILYGMYGMMLNGTGAAIVSLLAG